jgi:molybdopterin-containing oxidoreductase family iron-sulfur binding subunit
MDGRHANKPWSQEIPDPITSYMWGTWAEIHPDTAAEADLAEDNLVRIDTDQGRLEIPWFPSPGVRKDMSSTPC